MIASIGEDFCQSVRLYVPQHGAWYAVVTMLGAPALSGRVTLALGTVRLEGTVTKVGTRGEQTFARITAGAGSWSNVLRPKAYHNDAGVKAKLVAEDAAREAGESLETLTTQTTLGSHFVRRMSAASRVLEAAIGTAWHVGYDGITRVGPRAAHTPADGSYLVVDVQPDARRVQLGMDDLGAVVVGSVLREGLDAEMTVRDLEVRIDSEAAEVFAWCGGDETTTDRLSSAFEKLVARFTGQRIWGKWRYRVVEMDGDRVKLQAVSKAAGLPDTMPVDMHPGVAGVHAELALGAEVLVEFIEGKPTAPIITHFAGRGGSGFVPVTLTFDAATEMKWGANASQFVALAQDVLNRLDAIRTAFNSHTHPFVATGAASPTSVPTATMLPIAPVAATKVKAE